MGNCWSYQSNPSYYPHAFLAAVNYFRSHHIGTPRIVLDEELCKKALAEANLNAYYNHGPVLPVERGKGKEFKKLTGEIKCVFRVDNDGTIGGIAVCPFSAPQRWYEEICEFEFGKSGWQKNDKENKDEIVAPNFQTMIWRATRKVGVGIALSKDNKNVYICAKFDGDYKLDPINNVKKPINGLPALKVKLGSAAKVSSNQQQQYQLILESYDKWCSNKLSISESADQNFNFSNGNHHLETYIKKNPWFNKEARPELKNLKEQICPK